MGDGQAQTAQNRVIFEQMRQSGRFRQIVNANNLNIGAGIQHGTEKVTANSAKSINSNTNHNNPRFMKKYPEWANGSPDK